jgi:hypothetical protein
METRHKICFSIALLASVLFPVYSHAAEDLTQLIDDVRTLTLDTAVTGNPHFSDSQITDFLNQGQREILAGNHCLQQSLVFQLVPGTTYYPLPTNYVVIERVTIGNKMIPQMTPAALDSQSLGWEYASGYPNRYFINFSSRGLVGFAPFPQQSTDTDTIKVDYDVQANDLVNPTDYPYNSVNELQDYQHALSYWSAAVIEQIDQQPGLSQYYIGLFQAVGKQMMMKCRDLKNYMSGASAQP